MFAIQTCKYEAIMRVSLPLAYDLNIPRIYYIASKFSSILLYREHKSERTCDVSRLVIVFLGSIAFLRSRHRGGCKAIKVSILTLKLNVNFRGINKTFQKRKEKTSKIDPDSVLANHSTGKPV